MESRYFRTVGILMTLVKNKTNLILVLLVSLTILLSCGGTKPTPKTPKSLVPPGWMEYVIHP